MTNLSLALTAIQNKQAHSTSPMPLPPPTPYQVQYNTHQNNMEELKIQIRTLRMAKGWSQRRLAQESGMSQGTITRAERHGWISLGCLINISNALGTKLKLT